jgi:anion-transporting  ArsA/GET3 family ATPase
MEIIFVTGKGGVGKSAVAAALALQRARSGRKTLLAELGRESFYEYALGLSSVTYGGVSWPPQENLKISLWSGQDCLKEYALYLLKIESLYRLFFENPVTRTLIQVAPALPELSIIGKATSGIRHVGPPLDCDTLVVDSFASGHFMALLKAPQGMAEVVRFGPMGEQSRNIEQVLKNASICRYVVVTFPEELPVLEGLELAAQIESTVGVKPQLILNRHQEISQDALAEKPQDEHLIRFQNHLRQVDGRQREYLQMLGPAASVLPQISEVDFSRVVQGLSDALPSELL